MDEDRELSTTAKKRKVETTHEQSEKSGSIPHASTCEQDESAAPEGLKSEGLDDRAKLELIVSKLTPLFSSDKKFSKGLKILQTALGSSLSDDTAELFTPCILVVLAQESRVHEDTCRPLFLEIGQTIEAKQDAFTHRNKYEVQTWILSCVYHNFMFTDDTYRFLKGAKRIQEALVALDLYCRPQALDFPVDVPPVSEDLLLSRKTVVLAALETMVVLCYKYAWARPSVDSIFKVRC